MEVTVQVVMFNTFLLQEIGHGGFPGEWVRSIQQGGPPTQSGLNFLYDTPSSGGTG